MIIFNFIKYLVLYIKYYKILMRAYKDENLVVKLNQALNTNFSIDWIGRLYTVLNPQIQGIDMKDGSSSIIFDITVDGDLISKSYIEKWIMERINFLNRFIHANNLFELLVYRIEKLDEHENYLVVFEPILWQDLKKWLKLLPISIILIAAVIITLLIIF